MPLDYIEFAKKIKTKYPEYSDVDDLTLSRKMVEKYPEYKNEVSFEPTLKKKEVSQSTPKQKPISSATSKTVQRQPSDSSGETYNWNGQNYVYRNNKWEETALFEGDKSIPQSRKSAFKKVEDRNKIKQLNYQFKKDVSLDPVDQVYSNYDEDKKDNEYRVNNNNWERKLPGSNSWNVITNEGSVSALNRRYNKNVKYTPELKLKKQEPKLVFADVNTSLVSKTEENAVETLSKKYGKYGFTFKQDGVFTDYVTVYNKDKSKEVTVGFDEKNPEEALKLKNFLEQNASKSRSSSYDKIQNQKKTQPDYYKYISSDDYKNDFKSLSYDEMEKELDNRLDFISRTGEPNKRKERIDALYNSNAYKILKEKKKEEFGARDERIDLLYTELQAAKSSGNKNAVKDINSKITTYLNQDIIQDQVKNYSIQLNDLDNSAKKLASDQKKYLQSVEEFNKRSQSGQMSQEEFNQTKERLDDQAETLGTRADFLMSSGKSIQKNQKKLNVVAGKYVAEKSKSGGFFGGTINSFLGGVSKLTESFNPKKYIIELDSYKDYKYNTLNPEEKKLYKDKGYSEDQIKNLLTNEKLKEIKKEVKNALIKGVGSDLTTEEYLKSPNRGFFEKAIYGVAESAPAMLMGIGGSTASFMGLSQQAYSSIEDEMINDSDFETSSAQERAVVAVPYATLMGVLENYGLKNVVKGESFAGGVVKKILATSVEKMPKGASRDVLQSIMDKEVKNLIAKGTLKIANGAIAEFETGATQSLVLDIGLKSLYNKWVQSDMTKEEVKNLSGGEMFTTPDTIGEATSTVFEDGLAEAIGGATIGTFATVATGLTTGNISLYNEEDLNYLKEISQDSEFKKLIVANLKTEMLKGNLTKSEAQERLSSMNELASVIESIPEGLSEVDQIDAVNMLSEKNRLTKETQGKDPALVTAQTDRINEINDELKNISKNAVQVKTTGEVPVQPEARVGEEVVQGESKTEPQVLAEKGQAEELDAVNNRILKIEAANSRGELLKDSEPGELKKLKDRKKELETQVTIKEDKVKEVTNRIAELEGLIASDNASMQEKGQGNLIPEARQEVLKELEILKEGQKEVLTETQITTSNTQKVESLRAKEQEEIKAKLPNAEYRADGKIDVDKLSAKDKKIYDKIYANYDKLISPLLEPTVTEVIIDKPTISTNTTQEINRVKSVDINLEDGATFNIDGTKYEGGGLVVPVDSMNTTTEELTPEMVADFVAERQEMIGDAGVVKAGIYKFPNSNNVSIDLSLVAPESSRDQAIEFGRKADQESLFDLSTYENVKTGGTGKNPMQFTPQQFKEIAKALKEGRVPDVFSEQEKQTVSDKTNLVTQENVEQLRSQQTTSVAQKIFTAAKLAMKSLPDVKLYIHNTTSEFDNGIGEKSNEGDRGAYVNGEIHINLENGADVVTLLHEMLHHALVIKGVDSGAILDLAKGLKSVISDKALKQRLDNFISGYDASEMSEEYVVELGAIMSEAKQELTTTKFQQFKNLLNNIAKKLGLPVIFSASANAKNAVEFMNSLTKAIRTGQEIEINNPGDGGEVGTFNIPKTKFSKAKSVAEDPRDFIRELVEEADLREFNGQKFVTNMYDYTNAGETDLGNGFKINMLGGKNYVPLMMSLNGKKMGDVSNLAAFNTKAQAETFIRNAKMGGAQLFAPHSGTLSQSWQFQQHTFAELFNLVLDKGILTPSELINVFNSTIKNNADNQANFEVFAKKYGENIDSFNSFESDPKKIIDLLDIKNNYSPKLRKALNNAIASNKNFQKAIGINNKKEFYNRIIDPLNQGMKGGEIMNVVKFDPNTFEIVQTKESDTDHHPSFGWTLLAKINGIYQPTNLYKSSDITESYTKYNKKGEEVSRKADEPKFEQKNVSSSAGAIPKVAEFKESTKIKFQKNKTDKLTVPVAGNKLFNKPLKEAEDIAKSYMESIDMEYIPVDRISKLDENLSKRISDAYAAMKNDPTNPKVKAAYEAMAKETLDQYDAIVSKGYKVEINNNEPYDSSEAMINDLRDNKKMNIFSTEAGFGDEAITDKQRAENLLLKDSGKKDINGQTLLVNDIFRFVHDFFGHAKLGNSFGPIGEENAWRVHSEMYSPEAKKAMTSETRGQNSYVNFSGVNDAAFKKRDKARQLRKEGNTEEADRLVAEVYEEMKFADQKIGLLPEFAVEEGSPSRIKKQKGPQETRMDNESEDIFKKSLNRGTDWPTAIQNVIDYIQKSMWYQEASDIDREQKIRDFRESKKQKLKKAPSVAKILGKPKAKKVAIKDEYKAMITQIKLEAKAAREAKLDLNSKRKMLASAISGMVKLGKIKTSQAGVLIKRISYLNLNNPVMVERFTNYAQRVFERADYQQTLDNAFSIRKSIRELLKSDNQAEVVGMAKAFTKIDPSLVDDIDAYIEMADKVKNAVKPSRTKGGEEVVMKEAANIAEISEYTNKEIARQEEIQKQELLAIHDYLEDISKDMSFKELQSIVNLLKEDPEAQVDKEVKVKEFLKNRFDFMAGIIETMFKTGIDPMTGEEVTFDEKQKDLMKRVLDIDLNEMSTREAIKIVESVDNFLNNQITSGLESAVSSYEGAMNVKSLVGRGRKAKSLRLLFSNYIGKIYSEQLFSLPMLMERMFGGVTNSIDIMNKMGLVKLINGVNRANRQHNEIIDEYSKQPFYAKKNTLGRYVMNKGFMDAENVYERGMLAFLKRNLVGSSTEMKAEFERRVKMVQESINKLTEDGDPNEQKMGELYQKIYDKLGVAEMDMDIINANASNNNLDAIDWWINQWSKNYSDLSDISLSVYNTQLGSDLNYTPDKYKKLSSENQSLDEGAVERNGAFAISIDYTDKNKTGVLMETTRPNVMPDGRYISLDFDNNNSKALKSALTDINTASSIRQIDGFINSKSFKKLIPESEDRSILTKRINTYIRRSKGKNIVPSDTIQYINKFANFATALGVGKALGGISQAVSQTIPVMVNTFVNAGRLDFASADFNAWLNESGLPISNRGLESQSTVESIDRKLDTKGTSAQEVLKKVTDLNQWYLKQFLVRPDVFIARSSFKSYYLQNLNRRGISTNIDWTTHEMDMEAANYAQAMIDRQQNISDPMLAGEFLASDDPIRQIVRKVVLPFASFILNQKARMYNDLNTVFSKTSSSEDRIIASRSLTGLAAELATYQLIGFGIKRLYDSIAAALLGDEDDEEAKKKKLINATKYPVKGIVNDIISPIPMADVIVTWGLNKALAQYPWMDDKEIKDAVNSRNKMLELKGEDPMDEKAKAEFIAKIKKEATYQVFKDDFDRSYGMVGIAGSTYQELAEISKLSITGEFIDEYQGRETNKVLLESDREKVKHAVPFIIAYSTGLLPKDVGTISSQYIKRIKNKGITEKQYERYETVQKDLGRNLESWEIQLVKDKKESETAIDEIKFIERNGGLTERQGREYLKLMKAIGEPTVSDLTKIKNGQTADQILK